MTAEHPSLANLTRVFARIGCLSFGGPAGQIALMHKELVDDRRWIAESDYLHALNFCHLLPGPEAQQLATFIGWRLHGVKGGLVAGLLFVVPGALVILALSILYVYASQLDWFSAVLLGVKAAVLAIVAQALIRIGKRALDTRFKQGLAVAAFAGLFFFDLPFPLVVLGAGGLGMVVARRWPDWLGNTHGAATDTARSPPPSIAAMAKTTGLWLIIWALPMIAVLVALGRDHILWDVGIFFSQLAVVTFGGAYAVLAYMAQEAVSGFGWLAPGEMADGLGMAETTPGPLIMVTQFVGFLAAFRAPAPFSPLVAGILGAGLTTWVTFAPCFLWIFAFAPWIDRLQHATRLRGGLAALTAAVVGVIGNLAVWFALHVAFARVTATQWGPLRLWTPDVTTLDWRALLLTLMALVLLFWRGLGVIPLLGLAAVGGYGLSLI
jgi:chromate transporter